MELCVANCDCAWMLATISISKQMPSTISLHDICIQYYTENDHNAQLRFAVRKTNWIWVMTVRQFVFMADNFSIKTISFDQNDIFTAHKLRNSADNSHEIADRQFHKQQHSNESDCLEYNKIPTASWTFGLKPLFSYTSNTVVEAITQYSCSNG